MGKEIQKLLNAKCSLNERIIFHKDELKNLEKKCKNKEKYIGKMEKNRLYAEVDIFEKLLLEKREQIPTMSWGCCFEFEKGYLTKVPSRLGGYTSLELKKGSLIYCLAKERKIDSSFEEPALIYSLSDNNFYEVWNSEVQGVHNKSQFKEMITTESDEKMGDFSNVFAWNITYLSKK